MKQILFGTVSALALTLAVTGGAKAWEKTDAALSAAATGNDVSYNAGIATIIGGDNEIDQNAFQYAKGAFNVGQNESINSSVQQSMAIAAVINSPDSSDTAKQGSNEVGLALALGGSKVERNLAVFNLVTGHNELEDHAFDNAAGAFQVLQNHSLNSGVSQAMAIGAVIANDQDHDANPFGNQVALAASALGSEVVGNGAGLTAVGTFTNTNYITNHAFEHAAGAFNVLQNASVNSSVQQSMAIGAVVNRAN
jgi:hypothetical protein